MGLHMSARYAASAASQHSDEHWNAGHSVWASRVLLKEEVAEKIATGDADTLNRVLASLGPLLDRYVYTLCGHRAHAQDVGQETLATVSLKVSQLRQPCHLKPWAFRIARNLVWMRLRKAGPIGPREVHLDGEIHGRGDTMSPTPQFVTNELAPDMMVFWAEVRGEITAAVRELPDMYRTVVLLRDVQGASTAEVAAALSVSTDTVKTRLHRAHVELRVRLAAFQGLCRRAPARLREHRSAMRR